MRAFAVPRRRAHHHERDCNNVAGGCALRDSSLLAALLRVGTETPPRSARSLRQHQHSQQALGNHAGPPAAIGVRHRVGSAGTVQ